MTEWRALGDRAVRFSRAPGTSPRAWLDRIRTWPGVVDVVIAREDVAVYFDDEPRISQEAIDALANLREEDDSGRTVELPARYDGPDLPAVADAAGLTIDEVVCVHAGARYEVETMGFAPGFAYLVGLDPRLCLPRLSTPRTRVPAGSIALAGGYTGVYPFDSPGGWHVIGRIEGVRLFDEHGALLRLGDRVHFVRCA